MLSLTYSCVIHMQGYTSVSLPSVLVEEIKKHLENKRYSSVSEFVKESVRRRLEELNSRVRPGEGGPQEVLAHA